MVRIGNSPASRKKRKSRKRKRSRSRRSGEGMFLMNTRVNEAHAGHVPHVLLAVATLAVLGALIWGGYRGVKVLAGNLYTGNPKFTLSEIEARSDGVLKSPLIIEYAKVHNGQNLFELPLAEIRKRLEKHALIKKAVLRRQLPGRLLIQVYERKPIARMGRDPRGMNFIIDAEGHVISKNFEAKHLPYLLGVTDRVRAGDTLADRRADDALQVLSAVDETPLISQFVKIKVIAVGNPDYLDLRLAGGCRLLLPREDYGKYLLRAARMLQEKAARGITDKTIDLRAGKNAITN